jgi:hypothetical protein
LDHFLDKNEPLFAPLESGFCLFNTWFFYCPIVSSFKA